MLLKIKYSNGKDIGHTISTKIMFYIISKKFNQIKIGTMMEMKIALLKNDLKILLQMMV